MNPKTFPSDELLRPKRRALNASVTFSDSRERARLTAILTPPHKRQQSKPHVGRDTHQIESERSLVRYSPGPGRDRIAPIPREPEKGYRPGDLGRRPVQAGGRDSCMTKTLSCPTLRFQLVAQRTFEPSLVMTAWGSSQ